MPTLHICPPSIMLSYWLPSAGVLKEALPSKDAPPVSAAEHAGQEGGKEHPHRKRQKVANGYDDTQEPAVLSNGDAISPSGGTPAAENSTAAVVTAGADDDSLPTRRIKRRLAGGNDGAEVGMEDDGLDDEEIDLGNTRIQDAGARWLPKAACALLRDVINARLGTYRRPGLEDDLRELKAASAERQRCVRSISKCCRLYICVTPIFSQHAGLHKLEINIRVI